MIPHNAVLLLIGFGVGWLLSEIIHRFERRRLEKQRVWHNGRPCPDRTFHSRRSGDRDHLKVL